MATMSELYQNVILDHNRAPRNFRRMDDATAHAEGRNPLCGDQLDVWIKEDAAGNIADVSFEGSGCAISKASASLMTQAIKGKSRSEALQLFEKFHALVTGRAKDQENLGKLAVFSGVADFPVRVKCASLSWHTLKAALEREEAATTE